MSAMYVKIFSKIFESSIAENWQARVVFMDLLILADEDGVVDSTIASISRRTNCPMDFIKQGIEILMLPDPESRTEDDDGRRIELLDEHRDWGWRIINYAKYRDVRTAKDLREKTKVRVQRYRERERAKRDGNAVTSLQHVTPECEHEDASASESGEDRGTGGKKGGYPPDFEAFWHAYPNKTAKGKALESWIKTKPLRPDLPTLIAAVETQKRSPKWTRDRGEFIPHPATWLNQRRWEDSGTDAPEASNVSDWTTYKKTLQQ